MRCLWEWSMRAATHLVDLLAAFPVCFPILGVAPEAGNDLESIAIMRAHYGFATGVALAFRGRVRFKRIWTRILGTERSKPPLTCQHAKARNPPALTRNPVIAELGSFKSRLQGLARLASSSRLCQRRESGSRRQQ
jgi:hypothetical protein